MRTTARQLKSFAASDYGQAYHDLLSQFGKTADEWGELPADVRHFHESAHQERERRLAEQQDQIQ